MNQYGDETSIENGIPTTSHQESNLKRHVFFYLVIALCLFIVILWSYDIYVGFYMIWVLMPPVAICCVMYLSKHRLHANLNRIGKFCLVGAFTYIFQFLYNYLFYWLHMHGKAPLQENLYWFEFYLYVINAYIIAIVYRTAIFYAVARNVTIIPSRDSPYSVLLHTLSATSGFIAMGYFLEPTYPLGYASGFYYWIPIYRRSVYYILFILSIGALIGSGVGESRCGVHHRHPIVILLIPVIMQFVFYGATYVDLWTQLISLNKNQIYQLTNAGSLLFGLIEFAVFLVSVIYATVSVMKILKHNGQAYQLINL